MFKFLLLSALAGSLMISCQKQSNQNGNAHLFLSADTVGFDTVFVATATVTQQVKLINNNDFGITLTSVGLAGGTSSPFIINIDGSPGPEVTNLSLPANDSLIIFVTVFIKAGSGPIPFHLEDSIRISYNGKEQFVRLSAWSQNAHFLKNLAIQHDTIWPNDLPYVIYGSLTIDSNATLTIQPGTHIYIHADAPIYVDGSLKVLGDSLSSQRVYFTGDRLDLPYANYPGSWPGIFFRQNSRDNILNYAVLQNGNQTLVTEGPSNDLNPKLSLNQCIINNSLTQGILAVQSSIHAVNCLISNCGQNIVIGLGGAYQFEYCTVASYSTNLLFHQQPVLTVSNSGENGSQITTGDLNAGFINCIFWGSESIPDEAIVQKQGNTVFNVLFDHTILKQQNYPANIDSSFLWLNTDPLFIATGTPANTYNFQLQSGSPALNKAANSGINIDLNGDPRTVTLSDLGCYEHQ
ncbi:MAG TPA: choice-of-anchor Q domain-containing protein [Puia sp.]|nr:choice-of-anchor Q domain-containing protein [Puia sp.]